MHFLIFIKLNKIYLFYRIEMLISQLDFLSPTVTFYNKGKLSYSSITSGIMSIISFILIILIAVYFSLELIQRKNPQAFFLTVLLMMQEYFLLILHIFFIL